MSAGVSAGVLWVVIDIAAILWSSVAFILGENSARRWIALAFLLAFVALLVDDIFTLRHLPHG